MFRKFRYVVDLPNLTERISHLRDREGGSVILNNNRGDSSQKEKPSPSPERRFSRDYLMVFVLALFCITVLIELALIIWIDIL